MWLHIAIFFLYQKLCPNLLWFFFFEIQVLFSLPFLFVALFRFCPFWRLMETWRLTTSRGLLLLTLLHTFFFVVFVVFFSSDDSLSVLFRFAATWWTTRSAWWNAELSMTWRSWRGCENRRLFSLACARLQCEQFFYSFVALYVVVVVYFPPQSPEQEPPQPAVRVAVPEERRADPTVSPQIFLCFAWTSAGWLLPTSGWRTETYVHSHRRSLSSFFIWIWVSDFVCTSAAYHENRFLKQHNEGGSRHFAVIDISETGHLRNSTQKQKQL